MRGFFVLQIAQRGDKLRNTNAARCRRNERDRMKERELSETEMWMEVENSACETREAFRDFHRHGDHGDASDAAELHAQLDAFRAAAPCGCQWPGCCIARPLCYAASLAAKAESQRIAEREECARAVADLPRQWAAMRAAIVAEDAARASERDRRIAVLRAAVDADTAACRARHGHIGDAI